MTTYEDDINMYFELKGSPESTRKSYYIRINAFLKFLKNRKRILTKLPSRISSNIFCILKELKDCRQVQ